MATFNPFDLNTWESIHYEDFSSAIIAMNTRRSSSGLCLILFSESPGPRGELLYQSKNLKQPVTSGLYWADILHSIFWFNDKYADQILTEDMELYDTPDHTFLNGDTFVEQRDFIDDPATQEEFLSDSPFTLVDNSDGTFKVIEEDHQSDLEVTSSPPPPPRRSSSRSLKDDLESISLSNSKSKKTNKKSKS